MASKKELLGMIHDLSGALADLSYQVESLPSRAEANQIYNMAFSAGKKANDIDKQLTDAWSEHALDHAALEKKVHDIKTRVSNVHTITARNAIDHHNNAGKRFCAIEDRLVVLADRISAAETKLTEDVDGHLAKRVEALGVSIKQLRLAYGAVGSGPVFIDDQRKLKFSTDLLARRMLNCIPYIVKDVYPTSPIPGLPHLDEYISAAIYILASAGQGRKTGRWLHGETLGKGFYWGKPYDTAGDDTRLFFALLCAAYYTAQGLTDESIS